MKTTILLVSLLISGSLCGCSKEVPDYGEHIWQKTKSIASSLQKSVSTFQKEQEAKDAFKPKQVDINGRSAWEIVYGENPDVENLDLYLPEGEGPFPLVVFIHGGGWMSGSKRDGQHLPWLNLVDHGYAVASVNYALAPAHPWPEGLEDCQEAVMWLADHVDEFDLDPERIGVAGDSSGGHYALFLAAMADEELPVVCTAAWYPVTDLPSLMQKITEAAGDEGKEMASTMMQFYIASILPVSDAQALANASPVNWIHEEMGPVLLQHGDADLLVDVSQSQSYYQTAIANGVEIEMDVLPGAGHVDPAFETPENLNRVLSFFEQNLKNKS